MKFNLSVLIDNTAASIRGLAAEWGLSIYIESDGKSCVFDTGASPMLVRNAAVLDIDLGDIDVVALSHGHWDHTGGLVALAQLHQGAGSDLMLHTHPDAWLDRYAGTLPGNVRSLSTLCTRAVCAESFTINDMADPQEILPGITLTGFIPRNHPLEDTGIASFLDAALRIPDPLRDDQALVIDGAEGLTVVLGCCHAGLINTIEYVKELFPGRSVHRILGGLHLHSASRERLEATASYITSLDIREVYAGHCTGWHAANFLFATCGTTIHPMFAGLSIGN